MTWTTDKKLWACVKPNGDLLSFFPGVPQLWTKRSLARDMLVNPKHKVVRVVKVRVTVEEIDG